VNKGVIAYFIGLIFIVVAALALSGYLGGGGTARTTTVTTSVLQNSTNRTTTIPANSTILSTTTPTTSVYFSQCQSKNATEGIPNGDFATGSYYGWNVSGPGFGNAPLNLTHANEVGGYYGAPWSGYAGAYFATTYSGGLSLQEGNLTSLPFEVTEPYLNFRIVSPADSQVYVEILRGRNASKYWYDTYNASSNTYNNATGQYTTSKSTEFQNVSIPLLNTAFLCQNVSIRVVADAVGPSEMLNYIAVGDFYLSKTPKYAPGTLVNESLG